jgi:hypothetical protein
MLPLSWYGEAAVESMSQQVERRFYGLRSAFLGGLFQFAGRRLKVISDRAAVEGVAAVPVTM